MEDNRKSIQLSGKGTRAFLKKIDRFFREYGGHGVSDFNDLHFDLDCPVVCVSDNAHVVTNQCLADMEFYCVTDPFTAFQELSMYISGVMGGRSPRTVEISNNDRIAKHGFDKWSFRKEAKTDRRSCRKRK